MQKTLKTPETVTGCAQMTDCDGLPVLNWRSFFLRETSNNPSPIRHPSPKEENCEYSPQSRDSAPSALETLAREYPQPSPDVFFEPCEDGGRFRCFCAGARLAVHGANETAAPDDDLEARFADVLCAARLSEMEPSLCELVLSAVADAQRLIVTRLKKPIGEPVRDDDRELRVLGDLLRTLEAVHLRVLVAWRR